MNTLYSFGVPSNINQQGPSSSTIHLNPNAEENPAPRRGHRTRRPPQCGTHHRLGE
jgi:hypothetical protein